MVATRSTSSSLSRRRNLATIFDQAAARHAATPFTPVVAAQPAASSAAATFVAAVRTLIRTRFDEKSAKFVAKKCFGSKDERFHGNEPAAATTFTRMVAALQESFEAEDTTFASLFSLDDATVTAYSQDGKRVLLEFARKLLESDTPFQGTAELLSIKFKYGVDPNTAIMDYNAALVSARRKNTLDEDDVKGQFIDALDEDYYRSVTSRLLLHDQRAAVVLLTIQQWVRECHAAHLRAAALNSDGRQKQIEPSGLRFGGGIEHDTAGGDVMEILMALRKEVRSLGDKVNGRGFTPRADKPFSAHPRAVKTRFAASPLQPGNYSTTNSKTAFHRGTGRTIPLCGHSECHKGGARHWHRDCPLGGPRAEAGAHSLSVEAVEAEYLASAFQSAIDKHDTEKFNALCFLAGGKPEIIDDSSAASFVVSDTEQDSAIEEYTQYCQQTEDAHFAGFGVGAAAEVHLNTVKTNDAAATAPPPPPPSVGSDSAMHPISPLHSHEHYNKTFADHIAAHGGFTVFDPQPEPPLAFRHMSSAVSVDGGSEDSFDGEGEEDPPLPPTVGCGRPPCGFGHAALTMLSVCMLFIVSATAVPL
ncbi:hypothetical protein CYMTET_27503, partial [Cymbomonas tetramitiformis]